MFGYFKILFGGFSESFNVTAYANSHVIGMQPVSLNSGSYLTVLFMWDTTGFGEGDYTISASATVVLGEVDTSDNSETATDVFTILYLGRDVAVINIKPFKTVIGKSYSTSISVTVKNYGIFTETFNTTAYSNNTTIQTQTITLTSGNHTTLKFTLNTTNCALANYTLSAYTSPLPSDTETANNNLTKGWIFITIPGDVNGDVKVDGVDVTWVAKYYGSQVGQPNYSPNADVHWDEKVDGKDIAIVAKNYG
jgi:hypothetical protein